MRVRYCCTISCEVVSPAVIAACMSATLASNTSKGSLRGGPCVPGAWSPPRTSSATHEAAYLINTQHNAGPGPRYGIPAPGGSPTAGRCLLRVGGLVAQAQPLSPIMD